MASIFGHLDVSQTDYVYNATVGQQVLYNAAQEYLTRVNEEISRVLGVFVEGMTEKASIRYKSEGGGYLQERQANGDYAAVKASGSWDVAFPLKDFGAELAANDIAMAYMSINELENHIQNIVLQDINTLRFQILYALLHGSTVSFIDEVHGSLTLQPLANGDSVVYPPVVGSATGATESHVYESGYTAANISDANDPIATIVAELVEHSQMQDPNGEEVVVFINSAQQAKIEALTDYEPVPDRHIIVANVEVAARSGGLPDVPGKIIGRHRDGAWISVWNFIPAGWVFGMHLGMRSPLMMRVDPAATGLGRGLQLIAQDEKYPFERSIWRHRYGLAVANRLNGVAMELSADGDGYDAPTLYA